VLKKNPILFSSEHRSLYVPIILYFLVPNIDYFFFRTAVTLSSEHHVFFGYELLHDFHSDLPDFSFRTPDLFLSEWSSEWTSATDVRKNKRE
jgi:hypothetical protein